jgi:hypothetical protein
MTGNNNQIEIYETANGQTEIEVRLEADTVWLNRQQLAELFGRDVKTVGKHINNVFREGELDRDAVVANFATTAADRKTYQVEHYSLDVIISVGYRVKSLQGTQFRIWATQTLREFIIKGFVLDDERLKLNKRFGKDYFDELLERIREIRASERRFYQKITDIYALAVDYSGTAPLTKDFFASVQNKKINIFHHIRNDLCLKGGGRIGNTHPQGFGSGCRKFLTQCFILHQQKIAR